MIIESSSILVKSRLANLLVNFTIEPLDREAIALDIVECIALRLKTRDDDHVFNLALFVRDTLAAFEAGRMAYIDAHGRLTGAAMAARLGPTAFLKAVTIG